MGNSNGGGGDADLTDQDTPNEPEQSTPDDEPPQAQWPPFPISR